ncbi:MAG TPA: hypothetical protein VF997_20320 [Polyangia bacterium]
MKRAALVLWLVAACSTSVVAGAELLPGQGRRCDAHKRCAGKLQCVPRKGAHATCELACSANSDCPADQRCVKDAGVLVCRAISDADMDEKQPAF